MSADAIAKPTETVAAKRFGVSYLSGFGAAFAGIGRFERFGWIAVALFVPIVGPIAIEGYRFDALEAFIRGRATGFPRVDTNRFGEYLMRGVWVFLPALFVQFVAGPVIAVGTQMVSLGIMLLATAVVGTGSVTQAEIVGIASVGFAALFTLITIATLIIKMLLTPLQLRAGFTQDFGKTFNVAWLRDFLRLVWFELLMAELFFFVASIALAWVGLLFCIVGTLFAAGLGILAHTHLTGQLYHLYLVRGGTPIEFKEPTPKAVANWSEANQ